MTTQNNNPRSPVKEEKHKPPLRIPPTEINSPSENDFNSEEEEDIVDEGILNAREPSKIAEETYENPEKILR